MHVVLANKPHITVSRRRYDDLRATAAAHGRQLLHEATVGAGLPIMDTYAKLVGSGDRVQRIEGCPSGTLGYLFGELGRGRRFSQALRGAIAKGYPDPDPREDLSGMDVARKALILERLLGFPGELKDIAVESVVTAGGGGGLAWAAGGILNDVLKLAGGWAGRGSGAPAAGTSSPRPLRRCAAPRATACWRSSTPVPP